MQSGSTAPEHADDEPANPTSQVGVGSAEGIAQTGEQPSPRRPWLTWLAAVACVAVFLGLHAETKLDSWDVLSKWGYRPATDIWEGNFLPLVSTAFVHIDFFHLAFNLYWLLYLGSRLERAIGPRWYLLFFLVAAVVSSTAELAAADATGIGASGVVYAMFGFMWAARRNVPAFSAALSQRTIGLFLFWLVGCVVATKIGMWSIGNAAHFAGLVFGAAAGGCLVARRNRKLMFAGLSGAVALSLTPLFWCPWSSTWLGMQAYHAHLLGDYGLAVNYYTRAIRLDPNNAWAYFNRAAAYEGLHETERAAADFKIADELDPSLGD